MDWIHRPDGSYWRNRPDGSCRTNGIYRANRIDRCDRLYWPDRGNGLWRNWSDRMDRLDWANGLHWCYRCDR